MFRVRGHKVGNSDTALRGFNEGVLRGEKNV